MELGVGRPASTPHEAGLADLPDKADDIVILRAVAAGLHELACMMDEWLVAHGATASLSRNNGRDEADSHALERRGQAAEDG